MKLTPAVTTAAAVQVQLSTCPSLETSIKYIDWVSGKQLTVLQVAQLDASVKRRGRECVPVTTYAVYVRVSID